MRLLRPSSVSVAGVTTTHSPYVCVCEVPDTLPPPTDTRDVLYALSLSFKGLLSEWLVSSTLLSNVHLKSPPIIRPAYLVTIEGTSAGASISAVSTPKSTLVSKLEYVFPPCFAL